MYYPGFFKGGGVMILIYLLCGIWKDAGFQKLGVLMAVNKRKIIYRNYG